MAQTAQMKIDTDRARRVLRYLEHAKHNQKTHGYRFGSNAGKGQRARLKQAGLWDDYKARVSDRAAARRKAAPAKKAKQSQDEFDQAMKEVLDEVGFKPNLDERPELGIVPKGRAPKGQGTEYAARRWVRDRMESFENIKSDLQSRISRGRGTRKDRRATFNAQMRISAIDEALTEARKMIQTVQELEIPFAEARDGIFDQIFAVPTALYSG